ncbi:MAG TPA: aspartyl/asparaginyl beta-hydroxylase domain-containing protein [Verrucomicrobiae bacterium]|nr:aspartyl/asparaginyl beta-hydroxylase domain-containing protein [Verrucomicrobiae bacterium]
MEAAERAPGLHVDPSIISDCQKRSFLKLPVAVDREKLLAEYNAIPESAWGASHWDVHCSIDMILLRGGKKGSADDFVTDDVANSPLLAQMPYIASILAPDGPFGGAHYAFIFRTKPNGITRQHMDDREEWTRTVRIHVPIITNPGAVLLAEGRSKHLEVGEVWTFDNQQIHSVMNGDSTRVHMIFDVNPNPKFAALMRAAEFDPGDVDAVRWAATGVAKKSYDFANGQPLTPAEKEALQIKPESFATRVTEIKAKARYLNYSPLREGDIVLAVNGVETSNLSRSALDYAFTQLKAGERATFDVQRNGVREQLNMRLVEPDYFSLKARVRGLLKGRATPGVEKMS